MHISGEGQNYFIETNNNTDQKKMHPFLNSYQYMKFV